MKATKKIGEVGKVAPTPKSLPDPGSVDLKYDKKDEKYTWPHLDINAEIRTGKDTCYSELPNHLS
jgi:cryptochrome